VAHNLSVQGIHTYHVGDNEILVHNTCDIGGAPETEAGAAERLLGEPHTYVDRTRGGSIRNVGTDATHSEFADTLTSGGWTSRTSSDGVMQIFQKDGAKYVLRSKNSSGYPGWTVDFTPAGAKQHILEIRLGYTP
jgi:hypothetical protein